MIYRLFSGPCSRRGHDDQFGRNCGMALSCQFGKFQYWHHKLLPYSDSNTQDDDGHDDEPFAKFFGLVEKQLKMVISENHTTHKYCWTCYNPMSGSISRLGLLGAHKFLKIKSKIPKKPLSIMKSFEKILLKFKKIQKDWTTIWRIKKL